ncbi:MAG: hypothetical protein AB7I30_15125 [Isosphaeraceae bacterium]
MNRQGRRWAWVLVIAAFGSRGTASADVVTAIKGLDPVELVAGREVEGSETITLDHGRFRYRFANEANRAAFSAAPGRYSVAFDGACMRMGPLSGGGHADRFLVHEGRIYAFASDACRNTFRANPARFLDVPDAPPEVTPDSSREAARLLDRAVAAVGGADRLARLSRVTTRSKLTYRVDDKDVEYARTTVLAFPETYRTEDDYGTSRWGWLLLPASGHLPASEPGPAVDASVRDAMLREYYRHPLALLRAWSEGKAVAAALEGGRENDGDDARSHDVAIFVKGATTILTLDQETGRVSRASYRGRSGGVLGALVKTYADFREVDGLSLPFRTDVTFDGEPLERPRVSVESIRVDDPTDLPLITPPGGA